MVSVADDHRADRLPGRPDLEGALAKAEQLIYALRSGGDRATSFTSASYLHPYLDPADARGVAPYGGNVRTGLSDLDCSSAASTRPT